MPFVWNGQTVNSVGTHTLIDTSASAVTSCDSITTLNLTVNPTITHSISQSICQQTLPFVWNGQTVNAVGTHTLIDTSTSAVTSCDSITTLTLVVNPYILNNIIQSICAGQSYLGYSITGIYYDTFSTVGCDSVRILNLTVADTYNVVIDTVLCTGVQYQWGNQLITLTGTYLQTFSNVSGCDSMVRLNVSNYPQPVNTVYMYDGCGEVTFRGVHYQSHHLIIDTFRNTMGCDSAYHHHSIRVLPIHTDTLQVAICEGDSFEFFDKIYTATTVVSETLINQWGCDSTITLDLNVHLTPYLQVSADLWGDKGYHCVGDTMTIVVEGASTYWLYSFNGNRLEGLENQFHTRAFLEINNYTLVGSTEYGCTDSINFVVNAQHCCDVFMPNAFSPNGDGLNDAVGPMGYTSLQNHSFSIYNRLGQLVFKSNKMNDNWDGTFKGQPCEIGVYYYILNGTCSSGAEIVKKGEITLVR